MVVIEANNKKLINKFIQFQYDLYKNDKNFVPLLRKSVKNIVFPEKNILWTKGEHKHFLVFDNGKVAGRITAGINREINKKKGNKEGYLTLFETINNYNVAKLLFDTALNYLKNLSIDYVRAPISPTNGDEYRGCLVEGFEYPPVFLNIYNKRYYKKFFEQYGFKKYIDLYAYKYDISKINFNRYFKIINYAKTKYGFEIYPINIKNLENDLNDIKIIIEKAMPWDWPDLIPPDLNELKKISKELKPFVIPEYVLIARDKYKNPVGFNLSMLDFNQVLKKLNGKFYPWKIFKFLKYKKNINTGRSFVMFVIPEYRKKGVSFALYIQLFYNAFKNGLKYAEGSTIGESNFQMRADAEKLGGIKYKTYRIYEINIDI